MHDTTRRCMQLKTELVKAVRYFSVFPLHWQIFVQSQKKKVLPTIHLLKYCAFKKAPALKMLGRACHCTTQASQHPAPLHTVGQENAFSSFRNTKKVYRAATKAFSFTFHLDFFVVFNAVNKPFGPAIALLSLPACIRASSWSAQMSVIHTVTDIC